MRWFTLFVVSVPLTLHAQPPNGNFKFKVVPVEQIVEKKPDHIVVHFVTNRLVVHPRKDQPKWSSLAAPDLFMHATETPLVGTVIVKRDQTPDKPNDADLKPYTIESFQPHYKIRVVGDDNAPGWHRNDLIKDDINHDDGDGMSYLKDLWNRDVLIYVHGFNNDWQTAILRAAQLKRDYKKLYNRDFSIVVFSWPSFGGGGLKGILEYTSDERRFRESVPAVAKFLSAILLKDGGIAGRGLRWVVAHSMGNRVFLVGFAEMGRRATAENPNAKFPKTLFTRVVLAAPDMEVDRFKKHTEYLHRFCSSQKPMYFHAASNIAVNASEWEHMNHRAGVKPVVSSNLITIDAGEAKAPWWELGHGYYASNDKMVRLTADYFFANADPSKSADIEKVEGDNRWRLKK